MAYSRENYRLVREAFEKKRADAESAAQARAQQVYELHPDIFAIDVKLSRTGLYVMECITSDKNVPMGIDKLRQENEELQSARRELLIKYGYGEDYLKTKYECSICDDTGFDGLKMCKCMRHALTMAGIESSGIGALYKTQRFENFDMSFYNTSADVSKRMSGILGACINYAENFSDQNNESLLLMGATGLGKTHLTTSMAYVIIDKGYDVVYDSAQNIFSAYEAKRFDRNTSVDTDKFMSCDLLIIDDLGTEVTNAFTVSCLYNIINTRLVAGRATIINTNLTIVEINKRYTDRIASRILGEYNIHQFLGKDIRMQKLERRQKKNVF